MTLLRGGSLHPEPKTEETCVSAGRKLRFPRNQTLYIVSSSTTLWWANTAGKLRYFLNCIFKTFIVQNRTSWRHLPLLLFNESWLCGVGFFQCENFDLSRFLTLSQNIWNARDVNLRTILPGFCHLAIGWVLLKGFKCFTSAVPQQRKKEPCLEYKVQLQSEKWLCENGMFLINRSLPYVYYHFHMHVSLARVSLSLLFNPFASGVPAELWGANYMLSCLSRHKWSH